MMKRYLSTMILLTLGACVSGQPGAHIRTLSTRPDIAMTADYRMVYKRKLDGAEILCAEPSPDIGRIVSAATSGSLTGSAKGLEKVQPEVALAFAASRAEGLAQLGQRLATIQLLRDSTYRACEAYANRAISAATYAMIVSRYDDVMVTLLLGEMAAGAARPSSAALLGGVAATSGLSPGTAEATVKLATARVEKASAALEAATKALAAAPDADKPARQQAVATAQKEADDAWSLLNSALGAVGATRVEASGAPGSGSPAQAAPSTVATELAAMQNSYLNDFNLDAVTVGCLSALSQLDWPPRPAAGTAGNAPVPVPAEAAAANDVPASALVPPGPGVANGAPGERTTFLSTHANGAYSLQDECRAVLLNGQTLRAVARGRLDQVKAATARREGEGRP